MRALFLAFLFAASVASAQSSKIGVVLMHGKGGLPDGAVLELALYLAEKKHLVANLEMPWSSRRDYDVDVEAGVKEVEAALAALRAKGASKVFVAGHSQGGLFALHAAGRLPMDGVIAIAPGGDVANRAFRDAVTEPMRRARKLVASGRGNERATFLDYLGARGPVAIITSAVVYVTWFDPEGAMNQLAAIRRLDAKLPVLFIVPTSDNPALLRAKPHMVGALPANPLTKLYEPDTNHIRAATDSREEIARWIAQVAASR